MALLQIFALKESFSQLKNSRPTPLPYLIYNPARGRVCVAGSIFILY